MSTIRVKITGGAKGNSWYKKLQGTEIEVHSMPSYGAYDLTSESFDHYKCLAKNARFLVNLCISTRSCKEVEGSFSTK